MWPIIASAPQIYRQPYGPVLVSSQGFRKRPLLDSQLGTVLSRNVSIFNMFHGPVRLHLHRVGCKKLSLCKELHLAALRPAEACFCMRNLA